MTKRRLLNYGKKLLWLCAMRHKNMDGQMTGSICAALHASVSLSWAQCTSDLSAHYVKCGRKEEMCNLFKQCKVVPRLYLTKQCLTILCVFMECSPCVSLALDDIQLSVWASGGINKVDLNHYCQLKTARAPTPGNVLKEQAGNFVKNIIGCAQWL